MNGPSAHCTSLLLFPSFFCFFFFFTTAGASSTTTPPRKRGPPQCYPNETLHLIPKLHQCLTSISLYVPGFASLTSFRDKTMSSLLCCPFRFRMILIKWSNAQTRKKRMLLTSCCWVLWCIKESKHDHLFFSWCLFYFFLVFWVSIAEVKGRKEIFIFVEFG